MRSAYWALPRERCSGDASVSSKQTSPAESDAASMIMRTVACMEQRQPVPACWGIAMTRRVTPSGPLTEYSAQISGSDRLRVVPPGPRSRRSLARTGSSGSRSGGIPRVIARFGFGSPSMASTLRPLRAKSRDKVPEIEVLPAPPLPATASFILTSPLYSERALSNADRLAHQMRSDGLQAFDARRGRIEVDRCDPLAIRSGDDLVFGDRQDFVLGKRRPDVFEVRGVPDAVGEDEHPSPALGEPCRSAGYLDGLGGGLRDYENQVQLARTQAGDRSQACLEVADDDPAGTVEIFYEPLRVQTAARAAGTVVLDAVHHDEPDSIGGIRPEGRDHAFGRRLVIELARVEGLPGGYQALVGLGAKPE